MAPRGVSAVRASVANAERRLPKRLEIPDPKPGEARKVDGKLVKPGEWQPDFYGLPPDCPVEPLGMEGDVLHVMDAIGQLASVLPSALGQKYFQRLFGSRQNYLYWAWPKFSDKGVVSGWRAEKIAECLYNAAAMRGLFSPVDRVRGRGAWSAKRSDISRGEMIYHSGDALWHTGKRDKDGNFKPMDTGFHDGILYARRPAIAAPWPEPVTDAENPAVTLIQVLRQWNWQRPKVDPILYLGWLCNGMLGGALPWRSTAFVIGDQAVGKSKLQALAKAVFGDGMIQTADTSAAGIYQRVGQDSLPIAVDELEGEADNRKVSAVIKLARLSASGAMMLRGGQDHTGVEFRAQNAFFFSSINPPGLEPQDISRMCIMRLKKLSSAASAGKDPLAVLDAETLGPMLLRRLMDNWHRFDQAYAAYREVLRAGGHDGRGQDTFGVLLACADLALGPACAEKLKIPMVDELGQWGEWLATKTMLEYEDRTPNWRGCLNWLLTSRVDAWRSGQRHTVGQVLDDLANDWGGPDASVKLREANSLLAQAGMKVLVPGDSGPGWVLCVPNESQLLASLFKDSKWVGVAGGSVWKSALRDAPESIVSAGDGINRIRINGQQQRCSLVHLKALDEEEMG